MIERMYIQDAAREVGYKDKRSFRKWCTHYGVGILSDAGSKKQYVIKTEFEIATSRESIKYLMEKYGSDKLPQVLIACGNFNPEYMMVLDQKQKRNSFVKESYQPSGEHEKVFLARLTKYINE